MRWQTSNSPIHSQTLSMWRMKASVGFARPFHAPPRPTIQPRRRAPHVFFPAHPVSRQQNRTHVLYALSCIVGLVGLTYASVPLYRLFCQKTGLGGTVRRADQETVAAKMVPQRNEKRIKVSFNADTAVTLPWRFKPQQSHVYVYPGETALVFFTAENVGKEDVVGISTYNVLPFKVGAYFNKIQCFCFEEQRLRAGEQIDMPVFFFLDPDFAKDPEMVDVGEVTLSYTFFTATAYRHQQPSSHSAPVLEPSPRKD